MVNALTMKILHVSYSEPSNILTSTVSFSFESHASNFVLIKMKCYVNFF